MNWADQTVLLTGGTGTFGRAFLGEVLPLGATVRVFSRDEFKQGQLREEYGDYESQLRLCIGDVRDRSRVSRAIEGASIVVHAAALKQVVSCEYNPGECIDTNVGGSRNVLEAALDARVPRSILLSSDKAVHPINVYGASKLCAEKLWLAANAYSGPHDVRFSVVRYGNVVGSRGSVHEAWVGATRVQLTDAHATRFWLQPREAVNLVLHAAEYMEGGDVFVPKAKAQPIVDIVPRGATVVETGLRRGEKLHERLLADDEVARTWDCHHYYVVSDTEPAYSSGRVPPTFTYASSDIA